MALRFVIGRAGAGKTRLCLDEIRGILEREPDGPPLILLVPEQATFQTEYALLGGAEPGGMIRAQALSFRRLAFRVMQETGGTALVPIGENGRNMLLYKIVHRLQDRLRLFQGSQSQPGFIERLGDLMTEWKRYGVGPEDVAPFVDEGGTDGGSLLRRKLHDLRLIADGLSTELAGLYIETEDYLRWLADGFGEAPSMRGASLWVDGFHGFTPNELVALEALMRHCGDVTITFCLDRIYEPGEKPHELDLFRTAAETMAALREIADNNGVALAPPVRLDAEPPPRFCGSPMLAHLEARYRDRAPLRLPEEELERGGVSLHSAAHRRAEVEAVARDIARRVRTEGLRYRDLTVLTRNAADYDDYFATAFADCDIPYFIDRKRTELHHPLVEFIRSALEIAASGWRYEAVFRCIKTELLLPDDGSLSRESFDLLENYALAAGIDGNRWLTLSQWKPLMRDTLEGDPAQAREPDLRLLNAVLAAREAVVPPLNRFVRALKKAADVREMCEALYKLLIRIEAPDKLERWSRADASEGRTQRAREHRQLWDGVMSVLDQLTEMTGEEAMPIALFAGMVETGLESLRLSAVPPALDQVLVGSIDRTRSGNMRVCYVLGANDGVMPQRIQEDGVLTEQERETLENGGLRMAPGVRRRLLEERFLIYSALSAASDHLWISWPMADEEGKSLFPSEVIRQVKQLFPGLRERLIAAEPAPSMSAAEQRSFIAHPERTLSYLITQLRHWRQGGAIAPLWWEAFNWYAVRPQWQAKLERLVGSLDYSNAVPFLSADTADRLYGTVLRGSVSRLERFVSCPFQHFAIHGLRLRERDLFRLGAPDIGQLFHAALSRLAGTLGERWGKLEPDRIRAESAVVVEELAERLQSQILLSSERNRYVARKLKEIVGQAAIILGEHARRAQFRPVGLEIGFGPDGPLPPVSIPLSGGRVLEMAGRIDRVDAAETDDGLLLRVIDYKSGATQLRLEEVAYGLALQMLTYLDVLLRAAPEWLGQPAKPAGVLYFHVHNPLISSANTITPEKAREERLKRFKLKGLVLADERTAKMMDGELESGYSELLPLALKRDGGFYSSSSVVSQEQWDMLRKSVRTTLRRIGDRIVAGDASIEPYRLGAKTPCQFCAYKPVCQFDPLVEGNDYVKLQKPGKDDVWSLLAAGEAAPDDWGLDGNGTADEGGDNDEP